MTQFWSSFSCWTDGLTFDFRLLWYTEEVLVDLITAKWLVPKATKWDQIITPTPPCLAVEMGCLCWYLVFAFFFPSVSLWIILLHLHFVLVCPKDIVPETLWFILIAKEIGGFIGTFPNPSYFLQYFSYYFVTNFNNLHTVETGGLHTL